MAFQASLGALPRMTARQVHTLVQCERLRAGERDNGVADVLWQ